MCSERRRFKSFVFPIYLISSDSDLYPLLKLAERGAEDHGALFAAMLTEHLPGTYFHMIKNADR